MISVEQALELILQQIQPAPGESVALGESVGRVLAEEILSDLDSPPHDKSMVDGYAVLRSDLVNLPVKLRVQEEVTAGQVPQAAVQP